MTGPETVPERLADEREREIDALLEAYGQAWHAWYSCHELDGPGEPEALRILSRRLQDALRPIRELLRAAPGEETRAWLSQVDDDMRHGRLVYVTPEEMALLRAKRSGKLAAALPPTDHG